MIQTAIPAQAAGVNGGMTLRGLQALLGGQQMGGDGFAAIFQQLMMGLVNGEEELAMLMQQAQDQQKDDGTELGMKMMAELLLAQNPQAQALLEQLQQQPGGSAVAVGQDAAQAQQTVQMQPGQGTQPTQEAVQEPEAQQTTQVWAQQTQAQTEGGDGEALLQGRSQFQNAILAARQKIGASDEKYTAQAVDIEALQAKADAARFDPMASVQRSEGMQAEARNVVDQLKTGILDNLAQKNNEFVVKLKPDGLGEITIKLMEKENGISLSILASSPQVARLISNEVAALQNALRPLQAEVTQISTVAPQAAEAAAEYASFQEGFRQQQQFAGQQSRGNSARQGGEPDDPEDLTWGLGEADDDSLDVYI